MKKRELMAKLKGYEVVDMKFPGDRCIVELRQLTEAEIKTRRQEHGRKVGHLARKGGGQIGGTALLNKYGHRYFQELGKKGGRATLEKHGSKHYAALASRPRNRKIKSVGTVNAEHGVAVRRTEKLEGQL